jgi:hypothetical protein
VSPFELSPSRSRIMIVSKCTKNQQGDPRIPRMAFGKKRATPPHPSGVDDPLGPMSLAAVTNYCEGLTWFKGSLLLDLERDGSCICGCTWTDLLTDSNTDQNTIHIRTVHSEEGCYGAARNQRGTARNQDAQVDSWIPPTPTRIVLCSKRVLPCT